MKVAGKRKGLSADATNIAHRAAPLHKLPSHSQVKVAGKRKGLSAEATRRSSPMEDRICLRLALLSSLVGCFLKFLPYSALVCASLFCSQWG